MAKTNNNSTQQQLIHTIVEGLQERKGKDITIIELSGIE